MIKEAHIAEIREILENAGVTLVQIQLAIIQGITSQSIKQKHAESGIIVPGEESLETFVERIVHKHKKTLFTVNPMKLSDEAELIYRELTLSDDDLAD